MASYLLPPLYATFVWWFSTGAVLLLVGRAGRSDALRVGSVGVLLPGAVAGLSLSAGDCGVAGAYIAFTSIILLWGAQEIAFLAGWLTGPRPRACPAGVAGRRRLGLALQAILYHELALLSCGAVVLALTWGAPNQIGLWTFATLWVLRQSAKINLFLGVPVTNAELLPQPVLFLQTFFARKPVSAFFPVSVTLSVAVLAMLLQRLVEVAATPFEIAGLALVATLFALGVLEHWFMLLPMPAVTLWGWGAPAVFPPKVRMEATLMDTIIDQVMDPTAALELSPHGATAQASVSSPPIPEGMAPQSKRAVAAGGRLDGAPAKPQPCARQRLEDQFRQAFLQQHPRTELAPGGIGLGADAATIGNGRTS